MSLSKQSSIFSYRPILSSTRVFGRNLQWLRPCCEMAFVDNKA